MQPPGKREKKVYIFGPDHMTKLVAMPICDKKKQLKNLLLQNHGADCLEIWYVAAGEIVQ